MSGGIRLAFQVDRDGFRQEIDLTLPASGITALFGASGSGKTTCLRVLAGLERFPGAYCAVGETLWQDEKQGKFVPTHQRALGMVFQEASLFAHLTVRQNMAFGQKRSSGETTREAARFSLPDMAALLGINHLLDRSPAQLSGGERQRVAMARALLTAPQVLLMDEPLAALDLKRKLEILPYLERLHREFSIPVIYVSHAPDEIARLADYLVLLDQGRATASGSLNEVLSRLDSPAVFGDDTGVVIEARIAEHERDDLTRLEFSGGSIYVAQRHEAIGTTLRCRIHARDVSLALPPQGQNSILNSVCATVAGIGATEVPGHVLVKLDIAGSPLLARITRRSADRLGLHPGMPLHAQIKSVALLA